MIQDTLRSIIEKQGGAGNRLYIRTLLKEALQDTILRFVYNHAAYKRLIFTGGTCLRKLYGLPRLSEDLDFDAPQPFDMSVFAKAVEIYFREHLQYRDVTTKIAGQETTIFISLPILSEIGLVKSRADSPNLFLRCDISPAFFDNESLVAQYTTTSAMTTDEGIFFVRAYTLEMMFANKIIAFLERTFLKGKEQKTSFKGRDVFDLVWLLGQSARTGFILQPNWNRIFENLHVSTKREVAGLLLTKIGTIDPKALREDLFPFFESPEFVEKFSQHFFSEFKEKLTRLISYAPGP